LPYRKELFEDLKNFTHNCGIEHFRKYTFKTGIFPPEKAVVGDCRLGKWYVNLLLDHKDGKVKEETISKLNNISVEWLGVQTKIIGTNWY
jgi:hypothetical protein